MSGDHGLRVTVPASLQILQANPQLSLHLVGSTSGLRQALGTLSARAAGRLQVHPAVGVIPMDARPAQVLREAKGSSMQIALELLAAGSVQGVVSAGHTGALMALSRQTPGMLPGYDRPAACSAIPVREGYCYMLDLGANIDCSGEQLHQFARLGTALTAALEQCERPRVALLSNGSEPGKGNESMRQAAQLMAADAALNYTGYLEGDALFEGQGVDVVVCDGLLGNVALKVAEGTAQLAARLVREQFAGHWWSRLMGCLSAPQLRALGHNLSAELHGGAFLLGLDGVVVKSHGASTERGFAAAMGQALRCIENKMVPRLAQHLDQQEIQQQ